MPRFLHVRPYAIRHWLRGWMPQWVVNLGVFGKGTDCEKHGGVHQWYNIDDKSSGCYYCRIVKEGQLWKKTNKGAKE